MSVHDLDRDAPLPDVWVVWGKDGVDFVAPLEYMAQERANDQAEAFPDQGPWRVHQYRLAASVAQPLAWLYRSEKRSLIEKGLCLVYSEKQRFNISPHEDGEPLYTAPVDAVRPCAPCNGSGEVIAPGPVDPQDPWASLVLCTGCAGTGNVLHAGRQLEPRPGGDLPGDREDHQEVALGLSVAVDDDEYSPAALKQWLINKWRRHGEMEDRRAAQLIVKLQILLSLALKRAQSAEVRQAATAQHARRYGWLRGSYICPHDNLRCVIGPGCLLRASCVKSPCAAAQREQQARAWFQHDETGRMTDRPEDQAAEFARLNPRWKRVPAAQAERAREPVARMGEQEKADMRSRGARALGEGTAARWESLTSDQQTAFQLGWICHRSYAAPIATLPDGDTR